MICTDRANHCLRLVHFTPTLPETSVFAGSCTVSGNDNGHRLNSALFNYPKETELIAVNSTLYVLDGSMTLHMIDLRTDIATTLVTFDSYCNDMKILGDSLLYFTQQTGVTVFNLDTREESVVARGDNTGNAIGLFEQTKFNDARGMLLWEEETKNSLLVTDFNNNRFDDFLTMYKCFSCINCVLTLSFTFSTLTNIFGSFSCIPSSFELAYWDVWH